MTLSRQIEEVLYLLSIEDMGEFDQLDEKSSHISPKEISKVPPVLNLLPSLKPVKSSNFNYWEPNSVIDSRIYEQVNCIQSLTEMQTLLESITGYHLKDGAKSTVLGTGNPTAPLMLVGEAPGADEDLEGNPFVGHSGKMLQAMLDFAGLFRSKIYITNIIPWRPKNNQTPTNIEIQTCMPFITKHLQIIQPRYILMLGTVACKALLNDSNIKITKIRGQWSTQTFPGMTYPIELLATYHPSFVLRQPRQKRYLWRDILAAKQKLLDCQLL